MWGKFRCKQCREMMKYQDIVGGGHYICLDCYAWAKDVHTRNKGVFFLKWETDILLDTYVRCSPCGSRKMLTIRQADYRLSHESKKRPTMHTCKICQCYYRDEDAGEAWLTLVYHDLCNACARNMGKILQP